LASIFGFNSATASLVKMKANFYFKIDNKDYNYGLASPTNSANGPAVLGSIFIYTAFLMTEFLVMINLPPDFEIIFLTP